jgi:hypothetical protein
MKLVKINNFVSKPLFTNICGQKFSVEIDTALYELNIFGFKFHKVKQTMVDDNKFPMSDFEQDYYNKTIKHYLDLEKINIYK